MLSHVSHTTCLNRVRAAVRSRDLHLLNRCPHQPLLHTPLCFFAFWSTDSSRSLPDFLSTMSASHLMRPPLGRAEDASCPSSSLCPVGPGAGRQTPHCIDSLQGAPAETRDADLGALATVFLPPGLKESTFPGTPLTYTDFCHMQLAAYQHHACKMFLLCAPFAGLFTAVR